MVVVTLSASGQFAYAADFNLHSAIIWRGDDQIESASVEARLQIGDELFGRVLRRRSNENCRPPGALTDAGMSAIANLLNDAGD